LQLQGIIGQIILLIMQPSFAVSGRASIAHTLGRAIFPACWLFTLISVSGQVNVLTYHNDLARTGQNTNETALSPATVGVNSFGQLFSYSVDGYVWAQPLYVHGLTIAGQGTHNVVFVATAHNSVYAFDADSNLGPNNGLLWQVNLGPSAATPNNDFGNRYGPYHDINPEVGIIGTPLVDLGSGTIYLDTFTHEGASYLHRVHALNLTDGTEQPSSPVAVNASVPGTGVGSANGVLSFSATFNMQRPALALVNGVLYVCYTGFADTNPYHGWVLGFNPTNLQLLTNFVFNTTPNSTTASYGANAGEGGIWMSGNGPAADSNNNLYFMTGNGIFNAADFGGTEYGDSFVKLSTSGQLAVADYFSPFNQDSLAAGDTDLGSGGLLLLPDSVGSGAHRHLLVGCGKEGKIFLLDRDDLGHFMASGDTQIVQEIPNAVGGTWSSPAYFNSRVFYQGSGDVLKAYNISNAALSTSPVSQSSTPFGYPGATPSISANGTNSAIAWVIQTDGYPGSSAVLHAYNAYNLSQELYNSAQAGARDALAKAVKYTVPTIADGKVFVGAQKSLAVFANGSFVAVPTISPPGGVFTNSVTVTLADATPGVTLHYTLDNSNPTTNSALYSSSFVLTNTTTVKAVAFKPGSAPSQVAAATFINSASLVFAPGFAKQEFYSGATRANLEDPAFSTAPTFINYLAAFEVPIEQGDNFAERVSGYFIPSQTADYVFFVCSDDDSDLFLSTDSTPANKHLIASESNWSDSRKWVSGHSPVSDKRSDQFSGTTWPGGNTIHLLSGTTYYIEGVHHEGQGGDNFAATFIVAGTPDPTDDDPPNLAGNVIATYAYNNAYLTVTASPRDAVGVQGATVTFSVSATSGYLGGDPGAPGPAIIYQWQSAPGGSSTNTNIPNATGNPYTTGPLTLAQDQAQFRVLLTTAGVATNSASARLSVVRDTTPPQPVVVQSVDPGGTAVTVAFSEPLNSTSAQTTQNYLFSPGNIVPVSGSLDGTGTNLTLTTAAALPRSTLITLAISNVMDLAGNAVAPGTSISFSYQPVTYAADILFDQPIAYYRFEEPAGSAVATNSGSTGGNGAYLTGDGGAPSTAKGDPGPRPPGFAGFDANNHSATFDGIGEWVDTRNQFLQDRGAFTLEYWVAPSGRSSFPNRVGIVGQNDAVEYGFVDANTIQIWTPNGGQLNTAYGFADGEWHHVATIADGTSLKTYYDGVLTGTGGNPTTDYGSSGYNVHIGGGGVFDAGGNYFNGQIDEVAIFNKALPAARVAAHFQAGKTGGVLTTNGTVQPGGLRFTSISLTASQAVLQWTGTGTLEEAATVNGPWSPSPNQNNPQVVPGSAGQKFYRLRQ